MSITLKGMTWSHPRGYDPMVATSRLWQQRTGIGIDWDKRSLQDFESFPVKDLAQRYDLIVIDHPHVGQVTHEGCLLPLDIEGREAERNAMSERSVGASYDSYAWHGRRYAFPIDAAAQVMAYRADLLQTPPATWSDVLVLARKGLVALPLRPPHGLMTFMTLCANRGHACALAGQELVPEEHGVEVFEAMQEIIGLIDPRNFEWDPIAHSEELASEGTSLAVMPLGYGYASYSRDGFRRHRLTFTDIPVSAHVQHAGSVLGGTGIGVSAYSQYAEAAIDYAYWVASGDVQRGPYAQAGGQPGHGLAWDDAAINASTHDFYRNTRATLEGAWVRPRHMGYMSFQQRASLRLNAGLVGKEHPRTVVADINRMFGESF